MSRTTIVLGVIVVGALVLWWINRPAATVGGANVGGLDSRVVYTPGSRFSEFGAWVRGDGGFHVDADLKI